MSKTLAQIWREAHDIPERTREQTPPPARPIMVAGCVRCEAKGAGHLGSHVVAGLEPGDRVYRCQGIKHGRCDWTGVPRRFREDGIAICQKCKRYCVELIPTLAPACAEGEGEGGA